MQKWTKWTNELLQSLGYLALQLHSFLTTLFMQNICVKTNFFWELFSESEVDDTSATKVNGSVNILHIHPRILVLWKNKFKPHGLNVIRIPK